MELIYTKVGIYYFPDLIMDDQPDMPLRRYGRLSLELLEEYHLGIYGWLILSRKIWVHLADIDTACEERMDILISAIVRQEDVTGVQRRLTRWRERAM